MKGRRRSGETADTPGGGAVAALYLSALTHAYLLFNVFPYAGYMALSLLTSSTSTPSSHHDVFALLTSPSLSQQRRIDGYDFSNGEHITATTAAVSTVTVESIGVYAGLIGTIFALGRTVGFSPWNSIRRRYGQRRALLGSLFLSAVCSVGFGLASTYRGALVWRWLLGLSNGMSGAVKRMALNSRSSRRRGRHRDGRGGRVSSSPSSASAGMEGTDDDDDGEEDERGRWSGRRNEEEKEKEEERTPVRVLAVMSWGCALGPAVGGGLSDPLKQYAAPSLMIQSNDVIDSNGSEVGGRCRRLLETHPFVLPNVAGALLCVASMVAVTMFIDDDIPPRSSVAKPLLSKWKEFVCRLVQRWRQQWRRRQRTSAAASGEEQSLLPPKTVVGNTHADTEDVENKNNRHHDKKPSTTSSIIAASPANTTTANTNTTFSALKEIWKAKETRRHLLAYWFFSFVAVTIDESLPLFLISRMGGLGLNEYHLGWILSGAGLVSATCQQGVFELVVDKMGCYTAVRLGAALGTVPSVLLPFALWINGGTYHDTLASDDDNVGFNGDGNGGGGAANLLRLVTFVYLIALIGSMRIFTHLFFAVVGLVTSRTAPAHYHDDVSRIMTWGALVSRTVAPVVAGSWVSFALASTSVAPWWDAKYGSVAIWMVVGLALGARASAMAFVLSDASAGRADRTGGEFLRHRQRPRPRDGSFENRRSLYLSERQRAQVYVNLWECHYDRGSDSAGAKWRKAARKIIAYNRLTSGTSTGSAASEDVDDATSEPGKKKRGRRISWNDRSLRSGVDLDEIPFFIIGTTKEDESCKPHVLSPQLMEALHDYLPPSCDAMNFWLKYSLVRDGASIDALEGKASLSRFTVLAIETLDGDVFGSFTCNPWEKTNKYLIDGQSFLWRMTTRRSIATLESVELQAASEGDIDVFRWTGENSLCQLLANDKVAVGGGLVGGGDGFGIMIEADLLSGSSSSSVTYGNPCLCPNSEDGRFEVANIEIWAMTPFLFVSEAERSESSMRFIEDNKDSCTTQSAWSNFL